MLFSSPHARPRYTRLFGSSDALALAQFARENRSPLVVVAASALDAQRLAEEIPFFAASVEAPLRVHLLPDWETLPYDHFSPHQDLVSERLATLHAIRTHAFDVVVVPVTTALYPLPPVSYMAAYTFFLKKGETLDMDAFRAQMTLAGYTHVQQVLTPGEYCVRGGLVDLFPMGGALPFRIDLFDNEIETISTFDVDSQRTLYPVPEIRLLPAREFPLDEKAQAYFRQRFRERFEGDPSRSSIYKDVSKGIAPSGIEYYLPLFFEQTATLFDYLPPEAVLCMHHDVDAAIAGFGKDAAGRHNLLRGDPQRPLLEPKELFLGAEQFFVRARDFARMDIVANGAEGGALAPCATAALPGIAVNRRAENPVQAFADFLRNHSGRVLLLADSLGRREIMSGYLQEYGLAPSACENYAAFLGADDRFMLGVGTVSNGFILADENLAVVTEAELYAQQGRGRVTRAAKKSNVEGMLRDLTELKPGDPVDEGMIVGENARPRGMDANITKEKKLANTGTTASDDMIRLEPPRQVMPALFL